MADDTLKGVILDVVEQPHGGVLESILLDKLLIDGWTEEEVREAVSELLDDDEMGFVSERVFVVDEERAEEIRDKQIGA